MVATSPIAFSLCARRGVGESAPVNVTVTQLTDQLLASYARVGGINHLDGKNLPSKSAVCSITVDLLRLLFPGFFDEKMIHSSELKVEMVSLMDSVLERLEDEIYKSLEYSTPQGMAKKDLRRAAHDLTIELLGSLPCVRELLKTDVDAAFNGDPAALSHEEIIVAYPFVETIAVQDDGQWRVSVRLQNFSSVPTEFEDVDAQLEIGGQPAGTLKLQPALTVGPESADVAVVVIAPQAGAKTAVAAALAAGRSVRYRVSGQIRTREPRGSYKFEYDSALNPAPGLPGVLR